MRPDHDHDIDVMIIKYSFFLWILFLGGVQVLANGALREAVLQTLELIEEVNPVYVSLAPAPAEAGQGLHGMIYSSLTLHRYTSHGALLLS